MFPGISVEDEGELLWSKYRDTNPAVRMPPCARAYSRRF